MILILLMRFNIFYLDLYPSPHQVLLYQKPIFLITILVIIWFRFSLILEKMVRALQWFRTDVVKRSLNRIYIITVFSLALTNQFVNITFSSLIPVWLNEIYTALLQKGSEQLQYNECFLESALHGVIFLLHRGRSKLYL